MSTEPRLDIGTQVIELREAYNRPCRCGKSLTWKPSSDEDAGTTATTECECGMVYLAMMPTITIEGIDTEAL